MQRIFLACVLFLSLGAAALAEEMTGVITCSKCRHTEAGQMGCARGCIQGGVAPVFYDSASQKFYKVANPDAVKAHAGQRVVVTGNVSGDTLTVDQVKPAERKGS